MIIYNVNGIKSDTPPTDGPWFFEANNEVHFGHEHIAYELESASLRLHNILIEKIFGSDEKYFSLLPLLPMWIPFGGLDSDIKISADEFSQIISMQKEKQLVNQSLYFYDCRNLISTIQNSVIETKYLISQFYKIMNTDDFLIGNKPISANGVQFASGIIVTNITSIINYLFISLYSQLDFVTKLAFEFENFTNDFSNYPSLRSGKVLFGDKKRLKNIAAGSLFEQNDTIQMIVNIRNEIVHNSSIENMPKVYQVVKDNKIVEKFIFLPDFKNGNIRKINNRKRFYFDEVKLNELLPGMITEYWARLHVTLCNIN